MLGGKHSFWNQWPLPLAGLILVTVGVGVGVLITPSSWSSYHHPPNVRAAMTVLPGLTVENAPPPQLGLVVTSLQTGSEAARAGVHVGDDIAALDGRPVIEIDDAIRYLRRDSRPTIILHLVSDHRVRDVRLHWQAGGSHGT